MKEKTIENIISNKIIAIVRGVYGENCLRLAKALHEGGIDLIEVTFDQAFPERFTDTQAAIHMINKEFNGDVLAGAGTVTSIDLVKSAYEAGAKYIISPNFDSSVIKKTLELGMVSIPGALTPSEALNAYNAGADFVKLFPASTLGVAYVKAIVAPLNHIRFLAVGGINEKNVRQFLQAGVLGAGVGGNLVNKEWLSEGKYNEITILAHEYIDEVKAFKEGS